MIAPTPSAVSWTGPSVRLSDDVPSEIRSATGLRRNSWLMRLAFYIRGRAAPLDRACDTGPPVRAILGFVAIVTALGIAVSLAVVWTGGMNGPLGLLAFATMTLPAVAAYLLDAVANEGPRIDWSRLPAGYVPVALFLIPAVMH